MTAVEHEQKTEAPERALLRRTFDAHATVGDGRTIDVRIVPYGEPAIVDDGRGPYKEEFVDGAFDAQLNAARHVYLNFQHERGIRSIVGKGVSLHSMPDALYGTFRALEDEDGDKALTLVREEVLSSVSIEFKAKKGGSIRTAEGVVRRVKAHLDAVALCRVGAYGGAKVLAVREGEIPEEIMLDEALLPIEPDPELIERCRRLGIRLPQRYEAHTATDTPAQSDTPEADARLTDVTSTEGGLDA